MRTERLFLDDILAAQGDSALMLPTVWETALGDVPSMREQIRAAIMAEYPEENGSE